MRASFSDVLKRADAMKANACLSALPTEREFESCWSQEHTRDLKVVLTQLWFLPSALNIKVL